MQCVVIFLKHFLALEVPPVKAATAGDATPVPQLPYLLFISPLLLLPLLKLTTVMEPVSALQPIIAVAARVCELRIMIRVWVMVRVRVSGTVLQTIS